MWVYQISMNDISSAAISDLESAIRIAVQKIDLQPGHAFVSRVLQLSQLVSSNKTVGE